MAIESLFLEQYVRLIGVKPKCAVNIQICQKPVALVYILTPVVDGVELNLTGRTDSFPLSASMVAAAASPSCYSAVCYHQ